MNFELGTGNLMVVDEENGEMRNIGEIPFMSLEVEEWSDKAEPAKTIKGFTNTATFTCESANINQGLFYKYCTPLAPSEFTIECETPILIQARWHKKARIRKKWLKRYGYKEDKLKTIMKAKYGEFNAETGECNIEVESIEYIFKPYQLQREVR